jgi:hypothetical protein
LVFYWILGSPKLFLSFIFQISSNSWKLLWFRKHNPFKCVLFFIYDFKEKIFQLSRLVFFRQVKHLHGSYHATIPWFFTNYTLESISPIVVEMDLLKKFQLYLHFSGQHVITCVQDLFYVEQWTSTNSGNFLIFAQKSIFQILEFFSPVDIRPSNYVSLCLLLP